MCQNKKRIFTIHTNPFEYKLDWGEESFDTMIKIMNEEGNFEDTYFVAPSQHYANEYKNLADVNVNFIPQILID